MSLKSLRTDIDNPGDFTTLADWLSWLHSTYNSSPMLEDEYLFIENGIVVSENLNLLDYSQGWIVNTNGYKIIITNDYHPFSPYGALVEAIPILDGNITFIHNSIMSSTSILEFQGIVTRFNGSENNFGNETGELTSILFNSCLIHFNANAATLGWSDYGPTNSLTITFTSCQLMLNNNLNFVGGYINIFDAAKDIDVLTFCNNVVFIFANPSDPSDANNGLLLLGTSWICRSNAIQSYNSKVASILSSQGSDNANVGGSLGYSTQFIPDWNSSFSSIYANFQVNNFILLETQILLIDKADISYISVDYRWVTRPVDKTTGLALPDIGIEEASDFAPHISISGTVQVGNKVEITYLATDVNNDLCSLTSNGSTIAYQYALSPSYTTWNTMTPLTTDPLHNGVSNIQFTQSGSIRKFIWNASGNVSNFNGTAKVRFRAHDGFYATSFVTSDAFSLVFTTGWNKRLFGIDPSRISKINGLSISNISKLNGL